MTEESIIKELARWVDHNRHPFQVCNAFMYAWECDYWALSLNGETREFEIKISRGDYFTDKKKDKHNSTKGANYFYYVCPKGLIKKEEVDPKYGLIYVSDLGVEIVKKPRKLHDNLFDNWKMLAFKTYWRYRELWREKYIAGGMTQEEFREGFNLSLEEPETI
jgi:hypothetical protein